MNKKNYDREMNEIIKMHEERGERPTLLLHACCAPCASHCLLLLMKSFKITVFFYNPNITLTAEYEKRVTEIRRLIGEVNVEYSGDIELIEGDYNPAEFYGIASGLENVPEGGARCMACYGLRLGKTAELCALNEYDYFTTTLTISPLKNADKLNEIGELLAAKYGIKYLPSDFKKREGYKHSIELSKKYHLYRQNYCGCEYSVPASEPDNMSNNP